MMAKRIIKHGKYNVVTCIECGCEFSFDKVDIIESEEATPYVVCPECGAECTPIIKAE